MTYCKDCRTEFMVEADDPCPRCGRYLGGARMGQRAEVARPEQPAQSAQAEASEQADQADQVEEQVEQVAQPDAGGWGALRFRAVAWTWWLCVLFNPFAVLLELSFFHGARRGWLAEIVLVMGWSSGWWIHLLPLLVAYRWTVLVGAALGAWAMWQRLRGLGWNGAWSLACLAPWLLVEFMVLRGFAAAVLLTLNSAVVLALGLRWGEVGECVPAHWPQVAWRVVLVMWGMPTLIVVMGMLGFPTSVWVQCVVMMVIVMAVITILSKTSQRAAEERARAAAQQPPAAPAPIDEPPRPAQQVQTTLDAVADGRASLFMRLVWVIPVLIGWGLLGLMVFAGSGESIWIWVKWMVMGVLLGSVYVWFEKMHQRVAQTWRPAGESTVPASSPAPKAALEGEPNRLAGEERTTVDAVANGCASLFARLVLLVVLAIPALIGFAGLAFSQGKSHEALLWFLYLSVFAPPFCCLLTPYDELSALLREHPRFWKVWLWWVMPAVALFFLLGG